MHVCLCSEDRQEKQVEAERRNKAAALRRLWVPRAVRPMRQDLVALLRGEGRIMPELAGGD